MSKQEDLHSRAAGTAEPQHSDAEVGGHAAPAADPAVTAAELVWVQVP